MYVVEYWDHTCDSRASNVRAMGLNHDRVTFTSDFKDGVLLRGNLYASSLLLLPIYTV